MPGPAPTSDSCGSAGELQIPRRQANRDDVLFEGYHPGQLHQSHIISKVGRGVLRMYLSLLRFFFSIIIMFSWIKSNKHVCRNFFSLILCTSRCDIFLDVYRSMKLKVLIFENLFSLDIKFFMEEPFRLVSNVPFPESNFQIAIRCPAECNNVSILIISNCRRR